MPRKEVRDTGRVLHEVFGDLAFSGTDAAGAGVPPHRLKSAMRAGVIIRLERNLYQIAPDTSRHLVPNHSTLASLQIRNRLGQLDREGVPATLGEVSAALAWGLDLYDVSAPEHPVLHIPRSSTIRRGVCAGVRIRACEIPIGHRVMAPCGVSATSPLLSAIVVAGQGEPSLAQQLVVLHSGLRTQLMWKHYRLDDRADGRWLASTLGHARTRHQLLIEARSLAQTAEVPSRDRVLTALGVADPRVETTLESISWARFVAAQMRLPIPQALVRGHSGQQWRVDFLFGDRVIGECDGAVKYDDPRALWKEKKRQEDLERAGYIVVRWTWEEIVFRPHVVLARIALALSRAAS